MSYATASVAYVVTTSPSRVAIALTPSSWVWLLYLLVCVLCCVLRLLGLCTRPRFFFRFLSPLQHRQVFSQWRQVNLCWDCWLTQELYDLERTADTYHTRIYIYMHVRVFTGIRESKTRNRLQPLLLLPHGEQLLFISISEREQYLLPFQFANNGNILGGNSRKGVWIRLGNGGQGRGVKRGSNRDHSKHYRWAHRVDYHFHIRERTHLYSSSSSSSNIRASQVHCENMK